MYPKEVPGGAMVKGAVLHLCLGGEVLGGVDGSNHPLNSEEGSQVGSVRRDEDECEEPPDTSDYPTRDGPKSQ